jgi:hypothetical protein
MEEADGILFLSLQQASIPVPDGIATVAQITSPILIAVVSRCLNLISQGGDEYADKLPKSIAGQHRLCTALGNKFKELGYSRECGYNNFLYPNVKDTRLLLLWLVEKLPKSSEESTADVLGANALFNRSIVEKLTLWSRNSWTHHFCNKYHASGLRTNQHQRSPLSTCPVRFPVRSASTTPETKDYFSGALPFVSEQPETPDHIPASVLESNLISVTEAQERENEWNTAGLDNLQVSAICERSVTQERNPHHPSRSTQSTRKPHSPISSGRRSVRRW